MISKEAAQTVADLLAKWRKLTWPEITMRLQLQGLPVPQEDWRQLVCSHYLVWQCHEITCVQNWQSGQVDVTWRLWDRGKRGSIVYRVDHCAFKNGETK